MVNGGWFHNVSPAVHDWLWLMMIIYCWLMINYASFSAAFSSKLCSSCFRVCLRLQFAAGWPKSPEIAVFAGRSQVTREMKVSLYIRWRGSKDSCWQVLRPLSMMSRPSLRVFFLASNMVRLICIDVCTCSRISCNDIIQVRLTYVSIHKAQPTIRADHVIWIIPRQCLRGGV